MKTPATLVLGNNFNNKLTCFCLQYNTNVHNNNANELSFSFYSKVTFVYPVDVHDSVVSHQWVVRVTNDRLGLREGT